MKENFFKYPGVWVFYILGGLNLVYALIGGSIISALAAIAFIVVGVWWIYKKKGANWSLVVGFLLGIAAAVVVTLGGYFILDPFDQYQFNQQQDAFFEEMERGFEEEQFGEQS